MTNLAQHPRIFFQEWNNTLEVLHDALESNPEARTISLLCGNSGQVFPDVAELENALRSEMVVAAEFLHLSKEAFELVPENRKCQPVPTITSPLSIFKADVLRNNMEKISTELNGKGSLSDISAILNRFGFSSVCVATDQKPPTAYNKDAGTIVREWDGYMAHVENDWNSFELSTAAHFSSRFETHEYSHVLVDASGLEPKMNGTARNVLSFLQFLHSKLANGELRWKVTVVAPEESMSHFEKHFSAFSTVNSLPEISEKFDLGISITPITTIERCLLLNKLCVRWVVEHLDIIAVRSLPYLSQQVQSRRAIKLYLEHADEVLFISSSSQIDAMEYFYLNKAEIAPQHVIHLGAPDSGTSVPQSVPEDSYLLVLGNDHPHKQVNMAVDALIKGGFNVISFSSTPVRGSGHRAISPGTVSDDEMNHLIKSSTAVVFPSLYEGFGLPIAEAAAFGKQVILWNTDVSQEVSNFLGTQKVNYFCSTATELVDAARSISESPQKVPDGIRTIDEFNAEVVEVMTQLLSAPINSDRLNARWELFNLLSSVADQTKSDILSKVSQLHWRVRLAKRFTKKVR